MKIKAVTFFLAFILFFSALPAGFLVYAAEQDYTYHADTLNKLGLFAGTGSGYELERDATRVEVAVMVVKILGKDEEAKRENYIHPFTDVPAWADCYVGYIYHSGITAGISASEFGTSLKATPAQYATFMLKALGYSTPGDFEWTKALDKMAELKIITAAQASSYGALAYISRGVVVAVSRSSLLAKPKSSAYTLLHRLYVRDGAFDSSKLAAAAELDSDVAQIAATYGMPAPSNRDVLDSEAIFAACSSAVFYVEIFVDWYSEYYEDEPWGIGSGFFITADGVAVTNYHVIEGVDSIKIRTTDGKTYNVEKVLGYSESADIALIKVDRSDGGSFPYLRLASPYSLRTAQRIYCIGSPLGYDNTISDGLVSSTIKPYEQFDGRELIQISAPISNGSSGGPVINEFGDVVGVTSLGYTGENLNFAVPITQISEVKLSDPLKTLKEIKDEIRWGWPDSFEAAAEDEGDNDEEPTQELVNETWYLCSLSGADDVDLFSFPSEAPGELSIRLRADEKYAKHIVMELIDLQSGKTVARSYDVEDAPYKYVDYHIIEGSRLALLITSDGDEELDWNGVEYSFGSYIVEPATDYYEGNIWFENEPNGSFGEAVYVGFCGHLYADLTDRNDKDYYKFYVDEGTDVSFLLEDYTWLMNESNTRFTAELYNADERLLSTLSFTDNYDYQWNTQRLSKGWYYVLVTATGSFENESYSMYIGVKPENEE